MGENYSYGKKGNGVIFYVTPKALDSVDEEVDVIRTERLQQLWPLTEPSEI